jgi:carbonic anhydrase
MFMRKQFIILAGATLAAALVSCNHCNVNESSTTETHAAAHQAITNASGALAELKAGNQRFLDGKMVNTCYKTQIEATKEHQAPHSLILSCLDSRVPPEIIFDQGIGNIFVARVAGNVEDSAIVGSIEFAVKVKGTKLIVVMGHINCGAVHGAIDNVNLGHLTGLLEQIKPAIDTAGATKEEIVEKTTHANVKHTIADIQAQSSIVKEMVDKGDVKIVGAYYDLASGKVTFDE